jgi:hypothetical protein
MRWKIILGLAASCLAACATGQSSEQQRRISDCMAGCRPTNEPPRAPGPFDPNQAQRDQSSGCEQRCQAMK